MDRTDSLSTSTPSRTLSFPAMGNTAQLVIASEDFDHLDDLEFAARTRIAQLESRWSRFLASSDVTRLNTARGGRVSISHDTARLLRHMIEASRATAGSFNPFLLPALIDAGYTTSLASGSHDTTPSLSGGAHAGATDTDIDLSSHGAAWHARLANGATIDPGGIGKGLAADITAEMLMELGATGAMVSIGGDLRCVGSPPDTENWVVSVRHTENDTTVDTILLGNGGVATSTTHAKRWHINGALRHHVIDPLTLAPLDQTHRNLRAATVVASTAAWAEVFATAALISGLVAPSGANLAARTETVDGIAVVNEQWRRFAP